MVNIITVRLDVLISTVLHIPIKAVTPELSTRTCSQWDSISHYSLITELEKQALITIDPEIASELLSLNEIITALTTRYDFVCDAATNQFIFIRKSKKSEDKTTEGIGNSLFSQPKMT